VRRSVYVTTIPLNRSSVDGPCGLNVVPGVVGADLPVVVREVVRPEVEPLVLPHAEVPQVVLVELEERVVRVVRSLNARCWIT
jgi:hypothetical protein